MTTITAEATVREILELGYVTYGQREQDNVLVGHIMRVLNGHDTATLNGRSSEAFQGVSEYIGEAAEDNLTLGIELAATIFYSLNRYEELGEEQRIYTKELIQNFLDTRRARIS